MTLNYEQYEAEKIAFFEKHGYEYEIIDGGMNEYDVYHKDYVFEDGAIWSEVCGPTYETATVNIKGVNIEVEVKLFRTEFYSTESGSKYYYEKY